MDPYAITRKSSMTIKSFITGALAVSVALSLNDAVKKTMDEKFSRFGNSAYWLYLGIVLVISMTIIILLEIMPSVAGIGIESITRVSNKVQTFVSKRY